LIFYKLPLALASGLVKIKKALAKFKKIIFNPYSFS